MFEGLPDPATHTELSRAAMISAIEGYDRAEATCAARKLALIHRLLRDHEDSAAADEQTWAHDTWAAVAHQIGAALNISPRRASGQMTRASALAERLPKVAALLERGILDARVIATVVYRTALVCASAHADVDTALADLAEHLGVLTDDDLAIAIDIVVEQHDPLARRRFRDAAQSCDITFGKPDDATGTASVFGRIYATDAELARRILTDLANTVCTNDPRSPGARRAAAIGAVLRRQDRLMCLCATPTCPAASQPPATSAITIYVLAEQATINAALTDTDTAKAKAETQAGTGKEAAAEQADALARKDAQAHQADAETGKDAQAEQADAAAVAAALADVPPTPEPAPLCDYATRAALRGTLLDPTTHNDGPDDIPFWATRATQAAHDTARQNANQVAAEPNTDHASDQNAAEATADTATATPHGRADDTDLTPPPPAQCRPPQPAPEVVESPTSQPVSARDTPASRRTYRPAVTLAGTVLPHPLLAELLRTGIATIAALPTASPTPHKGRTFTGTLRRFIQCRDMTCRFPGCTRTARYTDIDHTDPHRNGGPTHASNGKLLCREHHLAKTFRGGPHGWRDRQLPDGTIHWTLPTGHTRTTRPRSALILPDWDTTTATLAPPQPDTHTTTGATMPTRRRTRAQDRQQHITTERDHNAQQLALGHHIRIRPPHAVQKLFPP